jgi:2-polyprenyl-3-methyl-5-hydroxy-6-metoxy-1,4-benzoquinol methylase
VSSRIIELAASIAQRSRIKNPNSDTVRENGEKSAQIIAAEIERFFGSSPDIAILDFGAAAGRVTTPLANLLPRARVTATDVDAEAIEYLQLTAPPNCTAQVNAYVPPLPAEIGQFDCIFAISVWSHFAEDLSMEWLKEMRRIAKPGALLLISTQGIASLRRLKRNNPRWAKVGIEQFLRDKYIFSDYQKLAAESAKWPGIESGGSWGITVMHPEYIEEKWGALFEVVEVRERGTAAIQDLVILRNTR